MDEKKMYEQQMLQQQIQQTNEHYAYMEKHLIDLQRLGESLSGLENVEEGKEMLVPLGSGIFFKTHASNDSKIVMGVGSNVCVEKSLSEAKQTVSEQIVEVEEVMNQLKINLTYLNNKDCSCGPSGCGSSSCAC